MFSMYCQMPASFLFVNYAEYLKVFLEILADSLVIFWILREFYFFSVSFS